MSSAGAAVRFEDGSVRFCIYHGTSDTLHPRLFVSLAEAWAALRNPDIDSYPEAIGEPEPVIIYSDYGGGWTWPGTATRDVVIGPCNFYDDDSDEAWNARVDGTPDWYSQAVK